MSEDYSVKGSSLTSKFEFVAERFGGAALHRRFYSDGEMRVTVAAGGNRARVHLCGAPAYSEADLQVAAGFYRGAAELFGLQGFTHHWTLREDGAHFELQWT